MEGWFSIAEPALLPDDEGGEDLLSGSVHEIKGNTEKDKTKVKSYKTYLRMEINACSGEVS